ncbi:MAG: zinc-binding alcohol dehydrogenase [Clostridia bacterium]|nr:zinc-binding alcohol dehydrogenase [Clostridia bacterium]MBQ4158184.1 zinc-binding alcohol dehydrogenase [Clostridia bacterium]
MRQIVFTEENKAVIREIEKAEPKANEVSVRMRYTAISAGTERANLVGGKNVSGGQAYPRQLGYSGSGYVEKVGEGVTDLKPGDRVITVWGKHMEVNTLPRENVLKIDSDDIPMEEAAFILIASFSLAAVRKLRPEIGESGIVAGLGLLGLFSVQFMRIAGMYPVIAVDMNEERRLLALKLGADYVFDPTDEDYKKKILAITGAGPDAAVEVTGNGAALNQTLKILKPFGRISLLGCTRTPTEVDFYKDVHMRGITMIGAHTIARAQTESRPGFWTLNDDLISILKLMKAGRIHFKDIIHEIHSPLEAENVYDRLANDRNFPVGVVFDWDKIRV